MNGYLRLLYVIVAILMSLNVLSCVSSNSSKEDIGVKQNIQEDSSRMAEKEILRQNKILVEYLRLDSTTYALEISEDEAVLLGVSREYYHEALNQIKNVNEAIKEDIAKGMTPNLPDFRAELHNQHNIDK
ncbi:MAG: hypothetical protein NC349_03235 [Paenibacillus sp.]|nr:hypothetical protein [Paenibacillus sp.]